jgi:hypothetical protein
VLHRTRHPLLRENSTWKRLYEAFEPSCSLCDKLSEDFWWLEEREPWKRISAEIANNATAAVMLESAQVVLNLKLAYQKESRETRH